MSKKGISTQDIEAARFEGRWDSINELVRQWITKANTVQSNPDEIELYRCLTVGESELERALQKFENIDCLDTSQPLLPKESLKDAHNYLSKAITFSKTLKTSKPIQFKEAHLLYAKYCFVIGSDKDTLKYCEVTHIEDGLVEGFTKRGKYIAAEALVCKGIALERSGESDQCDKVDDIIKCYELSGEISLSLLNSQPKTGSYKKSNELLNQGVTLSPFLKTGLLRPVDLFIKYGKVEDAILYTRRFLHIVETVATSSIRRILSRKLAEIITFSMCEANYSPPLFYDVGPQSPCYRQLAHSNSMEHKALSSKTSNLGSYCGDGVFLPQDDFEEALLLLLISESIVTRDTSVTQFPDQRQEKGKVTEEISALHNMLTFVLSRRDQYELLVECFEKGLGFVFEDFHLWRQFAMALTCSGKYCRAMLVLDQCLTLKPEDTTILLMAAKLCINNLHKYTSGLAYAQKALEASDSAMVAANALLAIGICHSHLASKARTVENVQSIQKNCLDSLQQAYESDPLDPEILYQLSLNQALANQIHSAITNVQKCLSLHPTSLSGMHLFVLLLSAQRKHLEALDVLEVAINEFPEDFSLMLTKIKLVQDCFGPKQALSVGETMLRLWSALYNDEPNEVEPTPEGAVTSGSFTTMKRSVSDSKLFDTTRSLKHLTLADSSLSPREDEDGGSSIAASVHLERTLSEAASGTVQKLSIPVAIALLSKIWLAMADLYLNLNQEEEATSCIQEAASVFPLSPDVLYMRGRLNELLNNFTEAKGCYESGLAISPKHVDIMQHLAKLYTTDCNYLMAEKLLRDSLALQPNNPFLWHDLGTVLELSKNHEESSLCLMTSLNLETTSPIVPYTTLNRSFRAEH